MRPTRRGQAVCRSRARVPEYVGENRSASWLLGAKAARRHWGSGPSRAQPLQILSPQKGHTYPGLPQLLLDRCHRAVVISGIQSVYGDWTTRILFAFLGGEGKFAAARVT